MYTEQFENFYADLESELDSLETYRRLTRDYIKLDSQDESGATIRSSAIFDDFGIDVYIKLRTACLNNHLPDPNNDLTPDQLRQLRNYENN